MFTVVIIELFLQLICYDQMIDVIQRILACLQDGCWKDGCVVEM